MSHACKCDRCGVLYEREHGCVVLDVAVASKKADTFDNWSDVDLCAGCSESVLKIIAPALIGLKLPRHRGKQP